MNTISSIARLNALELTHLSPPSASWHADYRDTAYIFIGGLPFDISEGDIITIFSQYGEVAYLKLVRDKESGKSRGFAYLKYEDQRSCDLAVDNLGGAGVLGRRVVVDHTRFKRGEGEEEEEEQNGDVREEGTREGSGGGDDDGGKKPLLKEEVELRKLERDHDEDDPMKEYLIKEKREEVEAARAREEKRARDGEGAKSRHHERKDRHHHRSGRRSRTPDKDGDRKHRHRHHRRRRSRSP